jgi:hypothetical protein
MLHEIVDIEAAFEVFINTDARNQRVIDAAQLLRPLDDFLNEQEAVGLFVVAANVGQQRQGRGRQGAEAGAIEWALISP